MMKITKQTLLATSLAGLAGLACLSSQTASARERDLGHHFGQHLPPISASSDYLDYPSLNLELNISTSETVSQTTTQSESTSLTSTVNLVEEASNLYPIGQCTWGVKSLATWASNYWGNANDWAANAAADGFTVGTTPSVGAIIVWSDGGYGHVGYVTDIAADGSIKILESNYAGNMSVADYRGYFDPLNSVTPGLVSYIYPPAS